jgi:hypothetical protein
MQSIHFFSLLWHNKAEWSKDTNVWVGDPKQRMLEGRAEELPLKALFTAVARGTSSQLVELAHGVPPLA